MCVCVSVRDVSNLCVFLVAEMWEVNWVSGFQFNSGVIVLVDVVVAVTMPSSKCSGRQVPATIT